MTRSFLTSMPCSSDWPGPHRLGPSMPPAVSGADPPWIGVSPFSKVRGRSLEDYNQFRLGVVNYSLRSSFSRPSAYRQRADDVSRAATRGMMDTQLARVSGLPKPPILLPKHGWHHSSLWTPKPPAFYSYLALQNSSKRIAVGTAVASRPPHRSVREALPHTAPPLGQTITTKCCYLSW